MQEDHTISQELIDHSFDIFKRFGDVFPPVNLILLCKLLLDHLSNNTDHIHRSPTVLTSDLLWTLVLHVLSQII